MDLDNLFKVVVYHLLIRGQRLSHQDGVPMIGALECITHWTGLKVSHEKRILDNHDFTKLLYYIFSQP